MYLNEVTLHKERKLKSMLYSRCKKDASGKRIKTAEYEDAVCRIKQYREAVRAGKISEELYQSELDWMHNYKYSLSIKI